MDYPFTTWTMGDLNKLGFHVPHRDSFRFDSWEVWLWDDSRYVTHIRYFPTKKEAKAFIASVYHERFTLEKTPSLEKTLLKYRQYRVIHAIKKLKPDTFMELVKNGYAFAHWAQTIYDAPDDPLVQRYLEWYASLEIPKEENE